MMNSSEPKQHELYLKKAPSRSSLRKIQPVNWSAGHYRIQSYESDGTMAGEKVPPEVQGIKIPEFRLATQIQITSSPSEMLSSVASDRMLMSTIEGAHSPRESHLKEFARKTSTDAVITETEPDANMIGIRIKTEGKDDSFDAEKKHNKKFKLVYCLILTTLMLSIAIITIILDSINSFDPWLYIVLAITIFLYLIECILSAHEYMIYKNQILPADSFLPKLNKANTDLVFYFEGYHFNSNVIIDVKKQAGPKKQKKTPQKIISLKASANLKYKYCFDESQFFNGDTKFLTKMKLDIRYKLMDKESKKDYEAQKKEFIDLHHKDVDYEFRESIKIEGFSDRIYLLPTGVKKPWRYLWYNYVLWSLVGMSVVYRRWFSQKLNEKSLKVVKIFQT